VSREPNPTITTDPEALAGWLDSLRAVLEDESDQTPFFIALFDREKDFYLQGIPGLCETVSRAYAP